MPTNNFLPFCLTDTGTNILSNAAYLAAADRPIGNQPGVASSQLVNKVLRQSSVITSQFAQYMSNQLSANVVDDGTTSTILTQIGALFDLIMPTGSIVAFGGTVAPSRFLLCDGSAVSRVTYAALFAIIGTTFGVGDGSTTFNLPKTAGLYLKGAGSQAISGVTYSGTLGATAQDKMQGHKHDITWQETSVFGAGGGAAVRTTGSNSNVLTTPTSDGTNGTPRTGTVTEPANLSVNYIIKI